MSDGKNPSRLSLALANAATQEIETILSRTSALPDPEKKKIVAVLARYIEMVR